MDGILAMNHAKSMKVFSCQYFMLYGTNFEDEIFKERLKMGLQKWLIFSTHKLYHSTSHTVGTKIFWWWLFCKNRSVQIISDPIVGYIRLVLRSNALCHVNYPYSRDNKFCCFRGFHQSSKINSSNFICNSVAYDMQFDSFPLKSNMSV